MTIVAVDPGRRAGIARYIDGRYIAEIVPGDLVIASLLAYTNVTEIVVEDFIGGGRLNADNRYTLLLVGKVLGLAETLGIRYTTHTSQVMSPFLLDAFRFQGKNVTVHPPDDVAALAHLMAFLHRHEHIKQEKS